MSTSSFRARLSAAFASLRAHAADPRTRPSRSSLAGAIACAVAALSLLAYAAAGMVRPAGAAVAGAACLIACCALLLMRDRRSARALERWKIARPALAALAAPLGFLLLELPSNEQLFAMDPYYIGVNLAVFVALFAFVYSAGQRSRASVAAFWAACLFAGTADHFVIAFKGQPIVPADLFALSTAASVSAGYSFEFTTRLVAAFVLFAVACTVLAFLPKVELTQRRAMTNTACAVAIVCGFGWWMSESNIEEAFACTVDVWGVKESYAEQGSALCFLKRVQDMKPAAPDGYDAEAVEALLRTEGSGDGNEAIDEGALAGENANAAADTDVDAGAIPASSASPNVSSSATLRPASASNAASDAAAASDADASQRPTVVAIMNETFSDLSRYPGMADSGARPNAFYDVAAESLASGRAYVSAMGGGTCNSEFEFLTGSSMGHLGGGVYPYVLYDLDGAQGLVSYFSDLGYDTHALHPAESTNWRRDRIYDQLGFDDFADIDSFEDADTLRDLVTDRATYDYVLDLLESSEDPQFVFDVTIQNHSGYDKGVPEEIAVDVPLPDGGESAELNEYASCIQQSDQDLAYLVERLNELDRPVVLCFFGDHQPGFNNWLFEETHDGAQPDDLGIAAVQECWEVPYLIWANDAARASGIDGGSNADAGAHDRVTSLNYLGAELAQAAGLPLTPYQELLLQIEYEVPAINLNGFMDADGVWHRFDDEDVANLPVQQTLRTYADVQYDNLFNKNSAW